MLSIYFRNSVSSGDTSSGFFPWLLRKILIAPSSIDREEGRAEGRAEGQAEGRASEIYIIRNQIEQVQRTPEETAELLVLEPEYIKKVAELLEEYPEETDVQIAARILKAGVCE